MKLYKVLITDKDIKRIDNSYAPILDKEIKELEQKYSFKYQSIIRILLFAYTIYRVDIGYTITMLSKYSNN